MGIHLALLLALSTPAALQTTHLACTMSAAKDRPFKLAVGQTKVAMDEETFDAVFTSGAVLWTKPAVSGDGFYLFTLDRNYRRITIVPKKDRRTLLGKTQVGSCKKLAE
jgi:hypothetical protein